MATSDSVLFQSHPEATWVCDRVSGQLLAANQAACDCYGYTRDEFLRMTLRDLQATPEPPQVTLPATGQQHRRKDGTVFPVALTCRDIDYAGRPARLVTIRDLAAVVALEEERRALETRLASLEASNRLGIRLLQALDGISDGLFSVDRRGRFTFVNREAERLLRRSADELLGRRLLHVLPEAAGTAFDQHCRHVMLSGQSAAFQEYYAPLDCWFDVRAYPTPEGLVVYFHDVSAERAQHARLQLLETAVSRLNDMVMITEAEPLEEPGPRILYVNDAFLKQTGFSREEALRGSPWMLVGPATDRTEVDRILGRLQARQPVRGELVTYARDGRAYRSHWDIVPIVDEHGRATHMVTVQRDVTEQRELEEKLRRSQRLDAVGQLTGGVAHDFNNLLTVILGNSELLAEELAGDARLHALAAMTRTAAERGAELTRRLLAFARRQTLDPKVTDVNELLTGMYGLLCRTLGEHIVIVLEQRKGSWKAMVDGPQLESAVLNLCLNARDAMPGGGRLTLSTGNVRLGEDGQPIHSGEVTPGDYLAVTVSDTGLGMPAEVAEHAFEPFFTTKETGKGSGLGLSMVYGFIKQSAGHVKIHSDPGRGTSVVLYLPRAAAAPAGADPEGPAPELVGGHERILLVEDDDIVRGFVAAELEELGYRVTSVGDGPQAMTVLRRGEPFDLLFTDMVMPGGMNGRELAQAAEALRPDLPVLFTSGYTEDAIVDGGSTGVVTEAPTPLSTYVLPKPYRRAELAAKIRQVLATRRTC